MQRIFLLTFIITLIIGCDKDNSADKGTYLAGEIINPVNNFILLEQNGTIVDTIYLNKRNRFSYKFNSDCFGLFKFIHREHQLVHIQKGDSILLRVNTLEFDESLSFSGKGSERSNFLVEMYLLWERENEGFTRHYQKNPLRFESLLDSLQENRKRLLERFLTKNTVSEDFEEIANAAALLDKYQRKESYPFSHYGRDKLSFIKELPSDFYSFRESIDLNNANLADLYAFQRYSNAFMDNQAYMNYGDKKPYNTVSFTHNHNEIKLIDQLITNTKIKDNTLYRTGRLFLANSNDKKGVDQIFTMLYQKISDEKIRNKVSELYNDHKKMEAGNVIPDLMLVDPAIKSKVTLTSRVNKPTVIYFWSYNNQMHMENSHKKIAELSSKYPEFNFLGINVNRESDMWLRHLKKHNFNPNNEYRFDNIGEARRKLVINDLSKTIVVDKKGVILNSHANLHRATFENELLEYLNQ